MTLEPDSSTPETSDPTADPNVASLLDFGGLDHKLVLAVTQLQSDADYAQHLVDRSHAKLYEILARCLELTTLYGKDHPAFKRPVNAEDGSVIEYRTSTSGRPSSPFRPVIWQVFRDPAPQTLYRYSSVLSLVEHTAIEQGFDPADKKRMVAWMKKWRRLDAMVDAWKEVKTEKDAGARNVNGSGRTRGADPTKHAGVPTPGDTNGAGAAGPRDGGGNGSKQPDDGVGSDNLGGNARKSADPVAGLRARPAVARIQADQIPRLKDRSIALFVGQWCDDGEMEIRVLDPLCHPGDRDVLKAWESELAEHRSASVADPTTVFLRNVCLLSRAIKERKRPRTDQTKHGHFRRRTTFCSSGSSLIAEVGLIDTVEGVTLQAVLNGAAWIPPAPAAVYRNSVEDHAATIEEFTRGDLRRHGRNAWFEVGAAHEGDSAMGVIGKLHLCSESGQPVTVDLVEPSSLDGRRMRTRRGRGHCRATLTAEELRGTAEGVESFAKYAGRNGGSRSKKVGSTFKLKCSQNGLLAANYDGDDEHVVSDRVDALKGKAFDLLLRTDDWLDCVKAVAKPKEVEQVELNVDRSGLLEFAIEIGAGTYRLHLPSCDADGNRTTAFVTPPKAP
jgi:hypothetical protein